MSEAVILSAVRTPIGRYGGTLSDVRPDDLAALVIKAAVERAGVDPAEIEDVYFGAANQAGEDNRNVARMGALLAGLPQSVAGVTVNRLCASGLSALVGAAHAIRAGDGDLFVAGGAESMSRAPLVTAKPDYGDGTTWDTTLGWRFPNPRMEEMFPLESMGETGENVAERYAGDWRVLAVDFRGRGMSEWDSDSSHYLPPIYAADVLQLLDELGIEQALFMGTSLGGLVTMIIATVAQLRIAGALLNDVGPELDLSGIDRIKSYVGKQVLFRDWDDAADRLQQRAGDVYPAYDHAAWVRFAKRACRQTESGVEFDYDMKIAEPFEAGNTGEIKDAWPYYRALGDRPVLVLRGEHSDLLPGPAADRMAKEIPDVEVVTVKGVGHAPDLDEPEAVAAIDRLLERVLKR